MSQIDWLSHLLKMITITGQLEVRCAYGAPWRVDRVQSAAHEMYPLHEPRIPSRHLMPEAMLPTSLLVAQNCQNLYSSGHPVLHPGEQENRGNT